MQQKREIHLFNSLFAGMGALLLAVALWIGASVAHIPEMQQQLSDFIKAATTELEDHETRLRELEHRK